MWVKKGGSLPLGSEPPHRGPGVQRAPPSRVPLVFDISLPYPPLMPSPPCTARSGHQYAFIALSVLVTASVS